MSLLDDIRATAAELTAWRRDFHAHPEIGREEKRTSAVVAEKLKSFGLDVHEGIGGYGVVAVLKGTKGEGRAIGLRADMDALPLTEETGCAYASQNKGTMHACGHDGHMTMLLGAAKWLSQHRDFAGIVNFIFQPAEEGRGGAEAMLADRLFERFPCDEIYGMHNQPRAASGTFVVLPGAAMSGADFFEITITGKGAHGSAPDKSVDPVYAGSLLVQALQQIVSRNADPAETTVVSVTKFQSGFACNVIPEKAVLGGCTRFFDAQTGKKIWSRIEAVCAGIATTTGADIAVKVVARAPVLTSTPEAVAAMREAARRVVGSEHVVTEGRPEMASEDFAFLRQKVAGGFAFIGNRNPGSDHVLHSPRFNFDDTVLPLGAAYWAELALLRLGA